MMKETEMKTPCVPEYFGCLVFDDRVMRARLSADTYHSLKKTVKEGQRLDSTLADEGLGNRTGRDPFYPLVSAADRHHSREA